MLSIEPRNDFDPEILKGDILENLDAYVSENHAEIFCVFFPWRNNYSVYDKADDSTLFVIDISNATDDEEAQLSDIITRIMI